MHTNLLARLEKGVTMQPAPPSTAPAFGASPVSTEQPQVFHFAAQTVRLATSFDEQEPLLEDATAPAAATTSAIAPINRVGNPYVHPTPELPVSELETLILSFVMQEVVDATILSTLNTDEEKAAFEDVLFVRAKAMTAAAAGAYHTTMIEDGAMAANAVTTGVIGCELDTGAEKSSMMEGTPCLTDEEHTHLSCSMANGVPMKLKSKAVLRATYYLHRQDHEWHGNEFTHCTLCVFVEKIARNLLSGLQLVQMGCTIVLAPGQCYIADAHGNRYPVKQGPRGFTVEFTIDAACKADSAHN
jgi:hypothetical protein